MAYADAQSMQQKTAGLAGAAIAHVVLGGLILTGLTVTHVIKNEIDTGPLPTREWKEIPPPEPQVEKTEQDKGEIVQPELIEAVEPKPLEPEFFRPAVLEPMPIEPIEPFRGQGFPHIDTWPSANSTTKGTGVDGHIGIGGKTFVQASPRNDPTRWVTDNDYNSRWMREGLSGRASFRLDINAQGRVENCAITRSTGHKALDEATCSLITKRARFRPAEASDGSRTNGIYTSSIRWQLPD